MPFNRWKTRRRKKEEAEIFRFLRLKPVADNRYSARTVGPARSVAGQVQSPLNGPRTRWRAPTQLRRGNSSTCYVRSIRDPRIRDAVPLFFASSVEEEHQLSPGFQLLAVSEQVELELLLEERERGFSLRIAASKLKLKRCKNSQLTLLSIERKYVSFNRRA